MCGNKNCKFTHKMYLIYCALVTMIRVRGETIISTAQGELLGLEHDGYESYGGIPYAKISIKSKFGQAGIAPSWSGIREYRETECSMASEPEDCLQLYVHTPSGPTTLWPVLVWVKSGSGHYNPRRIVQRGVIVVMVNYRSGPLGFLCTNYEKIPGNTGVKDVVLALRWIRDNIVAFKGNANKVVVAGQGFGAAIIETMVLSPMSESLFHGGILQSGTSLAPWAFNYDAEKRTNALLKILNIKDKAAILNISTTEVVTKSNKLNLPYFSFGLCLEKSFKNEESLLSDFPFELMLDRKIRSIPLIIGYNSDEAYIFTSYIKRLEMSRRTPKDLALLLPAELQFITEDHLEASVTKIHNLYFNTNHTITGMLAYFRDAYFLNHIHRSVLFHASAGLPVYYYQFSHTSNIGVEDRDIAKIGASHSDELAYLFPDREKVLAGDDRIVQEHLITLWTNFVKTLDPSSDYVKWERLDHRNPRLLLIKNELDMMDYPHTTAINTWMDIYEKYYYNNYKSN